MFQKISTDFELHMPAHPGKIPFIERNMAERIIDDANSAFSLDNTVDFMLLAKFSELECRSADAGRPISVDLEKLCRFANVVGKNTARYLEERMVLWLRNEHKAAVSVSDTARAETIDSLIRSQFDQRV
ncbi:hypothetical protein ACHAC9_11275 [Massilia sp. CMS3.1]|uniref:hypothetical protein n=1 Tax=Massilia sp. CMS3.1 TaxID=3373083 RepID=UPI003EE57256